MRYFAMIGGRRYGPMNLEDMEKEGVRPDTYVWCKGMPDWTLASEVPDICRYFRQRLSGTLPSQRQALQDSESRRQAADEMHQAELLAKLPPMARGHVLKSGTKLTDGNFPEREPHKFPKALPIILYIICMIVIALGFLLR